MSVFAELVPSVEAPVVDWQLVAETFEWFSALYECPQDPVHHGEGDVGIHTQMVVEALLSDQAWADLPQRERETLFWSALLHDVAKPACFRVSPEGRIGAPGHSKRGEIMARRILWEMDVPVEQREMICHLITHHQRPYFLIEKDNAARLTHLISCHTRCDLLATLARADARGRIAEDKPRLLDNIDLFEEVCREENCLCAPKKFASSHSRFLYFRKEHRSADYEAYDDWERHVTLLSGLPASGKDKWIAGNRGDAELVSLDDLRAELGIAPEKPQGVVIQEARERARVALRANRPLIWNATNISRRIRGQLIDLFADYRAKIRIVSVEVQCADLFKRNGARARPVPTSAIERMLDKWEPPTREECHAVELVLS